MLDMKKRLRVGIVSLIIATTGTVNTGAAIYAAPAGEWRDNSGGSEYQEENPRYSGRQNDVPVKKAHQNSSDGDESEAKTRSDERRPLYIRENDIYKGGWR